MHAIGLIAIAIPTIHNIVATNGLELLPLLPRLYLVLHNSIQHAGDGDDGEVAESPEEEAEDIANFSFDFAKSNFDESMRNK